MALPQVARDIRFVPVDFTRDDLDDARRLGEPLRSKFSADEMRALLAHYGFSVAQDEDVATIGRGLSADVARATAPMRHMRIATAERL